MAKDKDTASENTSTPTSRDTPASADQDAMPLDALARAVLAREVRPRAASVRRLAQGVLDGREDAKKARRKARKAKAKARSTKAKTNKKLATIPGQKTSRK